MNAVADPFGTAALRAGVLAAWRGSPTRFREDANAEADLALLGYADRLLVELAQNAADAAQRAGEPGHLRVTIEGHELRAANTGAPLDAAGVAALAALRASAKRTGESVGRFGVGFAAVLGVTDVTFKRGQQRLAIIDPPLQGWGRESRACRQSARSGSRARLRSCSSAQRPLLALKPRLLRTLRRGA